MPPGKYPQGANTHANISKYYLRHGHAMTIC